MARNMNGTIKDKIKELSNNNRLLVDNLVEAVWVIDAETLTYDYITPSIYKISGYSSEELVNTTIIDRLTPDSIEKCQVELERALIEHKRGGPVSRSLELEMVHKNGYIYWVEISAKFYEKPEAPLKIVGITRDISARKRYEKQLEDQNKKLVEALAEKEALLIENKLLRELLPICSGCKRIRDENGKWWPLDAYICENTDVDLTHTICTDCTEVLYKDISN